jgi:hypothetical protein
LQQRLAAFKASAEIERAEFVLVGPDRPITTTHGDQGDHGWCIAQDRSYGRLGRHQCARVDAIGTAGGVYASCPIGCRLDQRLPGHFGTSQLGR